MSHTMLSSSKLMRLVVIYAILIAFHLPTTTSETAFATCSDTEYAAGTAYHANLQRLLASLAANTSASAGFFKATVGLGGTAVVYGFGMCRGDLTPAQCQTCMGQAAIDAESECPGRRKAALWYDRCRIRYSDQPFFSKLTDNALDPYYFELNLVPDRELFKLRIGKLMKDLQYRAAYGAGSWRMFSAASINYIVNRSLYGLVQCTRDLSAVQCSRCLDEPIEEITCCQNSDDVTFHGGSCYLRYSMNPFYNASVASPPSIINNAAATKDPPADSKGKKKFRMVHVFLIVIFSAIAIALVGFVINKTRMKRKPKHITLGRNAPQFQEGGLQFHRLTSRKASLANDSHQKFDLQTLKIATDNFSDSRRLGRGEFGPVYKGDVHGREFVVKRLTGISKIGLDELRREFKSLKQVQQPNLVRLLAYHLEEDDKLLVYEYLPNTSLDKILFDTKKRVLLDWGRRYKIIEGIGRGLLHLHEESGLKIVHHNLKASNILLDKNMTPKVSDYCLAKLFVGSQTQGGTRRTTASLGYSETVVGGGAVTPKVDVFSYGVLVLEIITGQRNRDFLGSENNKNLLNYVWQYWKDEKVLQVLDWSLGELYKGHEVLRCIHIGLLCVQEDAEKRPNMSTVVHMLNSYSFTLPSPTTPSPTRVRRAQTNTDIPPRSGDPGNYNWKVFNQNVNQLSNAGGRQTRS